VSLATASKDFKIKNGLVVQGSSATVNGKQVLVSGDGKAYVSDSQPLNPEIGDTWFNSDNGRKYLYYDGYWVDTTTSLIGPTGPAGPSLTANDVARLNGWADGTIEPRPRWHATANTNAGSGSVTVTWFTPITNITVSNISMSSGTTAASGVTFARMGLYQTTNNGTSGTLLARTANDTSLFTTANTNYTRSFDTADGYPSTVTLTAGVRYGIAHLIIATTAGSRSSYPALNNGVGFLQPASSFDVSQTDLAPSISWMFTTTAAYWGRLS